MASYVVEGGKKLEGEVDISGSKNAALPIIAATILNKGTCKLYNIPNIQDTQIMFIILEKLGCKIKKEKNYYIIDTNNIKEYCISDELMRKMRSSVIIAGALLGRNKQACFSCPRRV